MLKHILKVVNKELGYYKKLADDRKDNLDELMAKYEALKHESYRLEQNYTSMQETLAKMQDALKESEDHGETGWKRRYERLTGRVGRTIAQLKNKLAEQEEDNERLLLDIRRLHNEVAERAEAHIRTREENASLLTRLVSVKRELAACKESMGEVDRLKDENYALWCENGALRAELALAVVKGGE